MRKTKCTYKPFKTQRGILNLFKYFSTVLNILWIVL